MDDTTAACNMINMFRKSQQKINKRMFCKSITTKLSIEHKRQLSVSVLVRYDPKTDSVVAVSYLRYCRHEVFPASKQSRNCHSQRGINILHANRASVRVYQDTHKEEINARQRARYAAHKEEINARRRRGNATPKTREPHTTDPDDDRLVERS